MSTDKKPTRILSMDQFRGYTVAGMFLVNYVGDFEVVKQWAHGVLVHNNTHFSYADSIMPSFMFCAGFSYRLTALRRFKELGTLGASWSYLRRSIALVFISLFAFGMGANFKSWNSGLTGESVREFLFGLVKAGMWETLAIIGVCQILILPFIVRGFWTRFGALIGFALLHLWATYSFNYYFQLGEENWFNQIWGAHKKTTWDGGMFGTLAWSVPMLAGTLVYDVLVTHPPAVAFRRCLLSGIVLMGVGYLLSCGTRLYDIVPGTPAPATIKGDHAADPVWPKAERWKSPGIGWAEPPFVRPPDTKHRLLNFWMMTKKFIALSFNLFALGFALALYSLFIVACDINHWELGLFRTLGQNPLAAYLIHEATSHGIKAFVPKDSPGLYIAVTFVIFFWITWVAIRYMEKHKLYLRL